MAIEFLWDDSQDYHLHVVHVSPPTVMILSAYLCPHVMCCFGLRIWSMDQIMTQDFVCHNLVHGPRIPYRFLKGFGLFWSEKIWSMAQILFQARSIGFLARLYSFAWTVEFEAACAAA